jgi:ATP-binding cassette subfamily F protein 3
MTQISLGDVAVEYAGAPILEHVTVTIARGDRWGLIGRNGSGKTSLFRVIAGNQEPTRGTVARAGGLRVSLLDQYREFPGAGTVWEAAAGAFADLLALERSLAEQAAAFAEAGEAVTQEMLERYDRDLNRFDREGGYTLAPRIDAVLHGLGFDPDDARTRALEGLSGGERGRLALARQLAAPGDILLLDEPTNHLDLETTRWLEEYLRQLDATIVLVSHDRALLAAVTDHTLHLEHGGCAVYDAGYAGFVHLRNERRMVAQRAFDKQKRNLAAEEDFIRRNIAGGNSRQAKGRRRRLERVERLSAPEGESGVMSLRLAPDARGGDQVLVTDGLRVTIGERVLLDRFTTRVVRGEIIGLVGPNGAGKSTLLRTILGERPAAAGSARIGESVQVAYYRQDLGQVPADRTLYDIIADLRPAWGRGAVQGHLGRFGFSGDEVLRAAATLSGGERARMGFALLMLEGANLLVLDEPTNHLDVETIEALEDALDEYDGTVILVSHDRALLRALTTRTWVLHDRHITDFPGGFAEWETASVERAHAAAVAAAEDEALRRVRERKETRRPEPDRQGSSKARTAQRAVESAERRVAEREARVAEIARRLEDPDLYTRPDGGQVAQRLGTDLDRARTELDAAIEEWTRASEEADRLTAEATGR